MTGKKLFLGGGGDEISAKELDDLYGKTLGGAARVLYVPIAWEGDSTYESCLHWFTETHKRFRFKIEMLTDLDDCTSTYLDNFDSIYVGGGNTFKLLHTMRETGFQKLLTDFINSGKVVYGGSAGAIILGKEISTATIGQCYDTNKVGITDLSGLNMVNDFAIHCHYEESDRVALEKLSSDRQIKILALSEKSGLYIEGDKITYVGEVTSFEID